MMRWLRELWERWKPWWEWAERAQDVYSTTKLIIGVGLAVTAVLGTAALSIYGLVTSENGWYLIGLLVPPAAIWGQVLLNDRNRQHHGRDLAAMPPPSLPDAPPPPSHLQMLIARYPTKPPPVRDVLAALERDQAETKSPSPIPFPDLAERLGGMRDGWCRVLLTSLPPEVSVEQYRHWFDAAKTWWEIAYVHIKAERPAWAAQFGRAMALEAVRYDHITAGNIPTRGLRNLVETACSHLERFLDRLSDE